MKFTKKEAYEVAQTFRRTFEMQGNSTPVLYHYNGRIDFSPGSQVGGASEPVYNGKADIIVEGIDIGEWEQDFTLKEISEFIYDRVQDFIQEKEEEV